MSPLAPPHVPHLPAARPSAVRAVLRPLLWLGLAVCLGGLAAPAAQAQGDPNAAFDGRFAPPGFEGEIEAVAGGGGQLVVGGAFDAPAGQSTGTQALSFTNVAHWDGGAWRTLGRGVNGRVYAAAFWNGGIVVGGTFTQARQADGATLAVSNLAFWTGTAWQGVAGGTSGAVRALAVQGTALVVGGTFTSAKATGGVDVTGTAFVASTDGAAWMALGAGLGQNGSTGRTNGVYALAARGGDVVVGGVFNEAYAAGGSVAARPRNVAVWSGAGAWSALSGIDGSGPTVGVQALAVTGTDATADVYVGGDFGIVSTDGAGATIAADKLARWTGSAATWSAPVGFFGGSGTRVKALLAEADGAVVLAGDFTSVNGFQRTVGIARLRGTSVEAVDGGIGPRLDPFQSARRVNALAFAGGGRVAVGGFFDQGATLAGGTVRSSALLYTSGTGATSAWEVSGLGTPDGSVYVVRRTAGGGAIVGGTFSAIGGLSVQNIARWDGARFVALGRGLLGPVASPSSSSVNAVHVRANGDVIVGGSFRQAVQADGSVVAVRNIARWDGTRWHAFGGFNSTVLALDEYRGRFYAGGDFYQSSTPDGSSEVETGALAELGPNETWLPVDGGFVTGIVRAIRNGYVGGEQMTVDETLLCPSTSTKRYILNAESLFYIHTPLSLREPVVCAPGMTGVPPPTRLASAREGLRFSGTKDWTGAYVYALEPGAVGVFAGAYFGLAHVVGTSMQSIRATTPPPGSENTGAVRSLARVGGRLYAGGEFGTLAGVPASRLAMVENGASASVGAGVFAGGMFNSGRVYALGATGADLFVGGFFTSAGGAPAGNVTRWASGPALTDSDADGVSDADEKTFADGTDANPAGPFPDSDGDLTPDYLDADSDGDGVPDNVEAGRFDAALAPADSDGDGIPDYRDRDSDGDGLDDATEQGAGPALDDDGDGLPNRLDVDSDDDGIADGDEGTGDANGNGLPDYRDAATARRALMALSGQTGPLPLGASGVLLDLGSNTAAATFEAVRFESAPTGTLPAGQANALGRYWRLARDGSGAFSTSACFALSGLPAGANTAALRLYKRETSADAWALLAVRLRTDVTPALICADNQTQFSEFVVTSDPAELPVELTAFTVQTDGAGAVVVRWETASETNNAGFGVETQAVGAANSVGAGMWTERAFVAGRGTTSERQRYTRRLEGLALGVHRVRLRQVDLDGAAMVSASVEVVLAAPTFSLGAPRPSPTRGAATVAVRLPAEAAVTVRLFDALGRETALGFAGTLPAGETAVALDASALAPGLYIVRATSGGRTESTRLVVAGR